MSKFECIYCIKCFVQLINLLAKIERFATVSSVSLNLLKKDNSMIIFKLIQRGAFLTQAWIIFRTSLVAQTVVCLQCGRLRFNPWVGKIPCIIFKNSLSVGRVVLLLICDINII